MNKNQGKISRKPKKKRRGLKIGLLVVLGLFLFSAGMGYAYLHNLLNSTIQADISTDDAELGIGDKDFNYDDTDLDFPGKDEIDPEELPYYYEDAEGITNIALYGIDAPLGEKGRSDAIMIITVDRNTKKIKLTSIIRDSYVSIPGHGMDKVNHAYAFGGPELALKTLNQNFHLDIRHFASVNFTTLPEIIDIIDGVEIKVTDTEATQIGGINSAGTYNLTGEQALTYSRIRKVDSDFARAERQRTVIEAIIQKTLKSSLTSYPGILSEVLPLVTTNMDSKEILSLATSVVTNGIRTVEQNRFPEENYSSGQKIKGIYYYVFNRDKAVKSIGEYIYKDIRSTIKSVEP